MGLSELKAELKALEPTLYAESITQLAHEGISQSKIKDYMVELKPYKALAFTPYVFGSLVQKGVLGTKSCFYMTGGALINYACLTQPSVSQRLRYELKWL